MARMYPDVFPGKWDPQNPEFEVYQMLKMLPHSYHVLYSKRINGGLFGKAECEIDFIIFNGHDVLICLEVKGGLIAYDGAETKWTQNGSIIKDVIKQATDSTHALKRALDFETRNMCVDWALCFPNCCLSSHAGALEVQPQQIIDEKDLASPEEAVLRLERHIKAKFGTRPGLSVTERRALIDRLTRSIGFVQVLGVRMAREAEQIVQVTNEQLEVLNDLEANGRMLVQGSAGAGKTIIAQEFAKRLADQKQTVLLLFYNKGIARKARYAFERDGTVQASTFSSFAKRLVERVDQAWWDSFKTKDNEFWHTTLPLKLLDIPENQLEKFDAIIVDEGQDFKPEWFEFLSRILKSGQESHYTVLLDENQDIFKHWKSFPCQPPPAKKLLTKNCRNTKQIVEYINKRHPTGMRTFDHSPTGAPVVERHSANENDELKQITRDIKQLTGKDQIPPASIVVLINSPKDDSCLRGLTRLAGFELKSTYERYQPGANSIYYSTIDIFKGLEADVIFLVLGDALDTESLPQSIYVQASRAKHLLYIYDRETRK
jgi:hypothetical protein